MQSQQLALPTAILRSVGTADNGQAGKIFLMRFLINELIVQCNELHPEGERMHMERVAQAIGVPRSTLAGLTTLTREPVTNTATFEALCRFFRRHLPEFQPAMLIEFDPPLGEQTETRVDLLYPRRAAKGAAYRRERPTME